MLTDQSREDGSHADDRRGPQLLTCAVEFDVDGLCAGVKTVLNQLLDHRAKTYNDLRAAEERGFKLSYCKKDQYHHDSSKQHKCVKTLFPRT